MRVAVFNSKPYDRTYLSTANGDRHELHFFESRLTLDTAPLAQGFSAVAAFVNDILDRPVLQTLAAQGIHCLVLRSAGFNHVDLVAAAELGIQVARVPEYSPHAVAEHTVGLILALNRHIHRAYNRVREGNFSLDGLLGFDLHGRTVGVIGTGKIGRNFARIMHGFGCRILAEDPFPSGEITALGGEYVNRTALLQTADIVSLHCPLTPETHHLINRETLQVMKSGAMLVNTSRGGLVDTAALIDALKQGHLGALGLDVYEEEGDLFFQDLSAQVIQDDVFSRLLTFPNVLITGHQAYFTQEALRNIAATTIANLDAFASGSPCPNQVTTDYLR
jgi:D-lactate dehydrogenase